MSRLAAHEITIEVNAALNVSEKTATMCLLLLETYMNAHPELDLVGQRQNDGTIKLNFKRKGQAEP